MTQKHTKLLKTRLQGLNMSWMKSETKMKKIGGVEWDTGERTTGDPLASLLGSCRVVHLYIGLSSQMPLFWIQQWNFQTSAACKNCTMVQNNIGVMSALIRQNKLTETSDTPNVQICP